MYIYISVLSRHFTPNTRASETTQKERIEEERRKRKKERREKKKIMRFFLTALISSMTIITTTLSIPLYYHNRNRKSQALILRQQTQLLTSLVNEPIITQRLRSEAEQQAPLKSGWTERGKDWWNEEVIRRAVDLLFGGPAPLGGFSAAAAAG